MAQGSGSWLAGVETFTLQALLTYELAVGTLVHRSDSALGKSQACPRERGR